MTNGEMFKTPRERADGFKSFCEAHDCKCTGCPLDCTGGCRDESLFAWLELESEAAQ